MDESEMIARLRTALSEFVYETTCLSPMNDDGSHWCKISKETLQVGRETLHATAPVEPARPFDGVMKRC